MTGKVVSRKSGQRSGTQSTRNEERPRTSRAAEAAERAGTEADHGEILPGPESAGLDAQTASMAGLWNEISETTQRIVLKLEESHAVAEDIKRQIAAARNALIP